MTLRQLASIGSATATMFWFAVASTIATGLPRPWFAQPRAAATWARLLWVGLTGGAAQLLDTAALHLALVSVLSLFDKAQLVWATAIGGLVWRTRPAGRHGRAAIIVASGLHIVHRERRRRTQSLIGRRLALMAAVAESAPGDKRA